MKLARFFDYYARIYHLFSLAGTIRFIVSYLRYSIFPLQKGELGAISVGKHTFYVPSARDFAVSFFKEISFSEYYYLEHTLEPIRVLDCGANIGDSLLYIKQQAPNALVTCFEPNPAARAVLEKNIHANKWTDTTSVLPYALAKEPGTAEFFVQEDIDTSGGGSLTTFLSSKNVPLTSYPVEVRTLSEFIEGPVDLLKIDIEGGEFDVLDEIVATGKISNVSSIQLEYHFNPEYFKRSLSELLTLLEKEGFKVFALPCNMPHTVVGKDTRHQYMVFAWR